MKVIGWFTGIILSTTIIFAQPREGHNTEFSLTGGYQSKSNHNSSYSTSTLLLSSRLGFYLIKGLELEPEILFMTVEGRDPVYMVNGNVSYNFILGNRGVPFLLVGYGLANTIPYFYLPITRIEFGVGVLNIGGGVKAFLADDIALRIEYRYQYFSGEGNVPNDFLNPLRQTIETKLHSVLFGVSVLL